MTLDGLREKYGDKYLKCQTCGHYRKMSDLIDSFEDEHTEVLFDAQEIKDLQYTNCSNCGALKLHELKDTIESDAESEEPDEADDHSKPENDATGQSESDNDSTKPFSI